MLARASAATPTSSLEVVNGIAFFTPLWWFLRAPRVALVHHVHQDHYVAGARAAAGASRRSCSRRLPLRFLYRAHAVPDDLAGGARDLVALGVPAEHVHVAYLGVEPVAVPPGRRAPSARRCCTSAA